MLDHASQSIMFPDKFQRRFWTDASDRFEIVTSEKNTEVYELWHKGKSGR